MTASRLGHTHPPVAVLLSIHYKHLTLTEGQLIRMVSGAVVDGLHPLRPLLLHETESRALSRQQTARRTREACGRTDLQRRRSWVWGWEAEAPGCGGACPQSLWRQQKQKLLLHSDGKGDPEVSRTLPAGGTCSGEAPGWLTLGVLAGGLCGRWLPDLRTQRQSPQMGDEASHRSSRNQ